MNVQGQKRPRTPSPVSKKKSALQDGTSRRHENASETSVDSWRALKDLQQSQSALRTGAGRHATQPARTISLAAARNRLRSSVDPTKRSTIWRSSTASRRVVVGRRCRYGDQAQGRPRPYINAAQPIPSSPVGNLQTILADREVREARRRPVESGRPGRCHGAGLSRRVFNAKFPPWRPPLDPTTAPIAGAAENPKPGVS